MRWRVIVDWTVSLSCVLLAGCSRFGDNPTSWLMVIIGVAAALAFYFQVLKDW